MKKRLIALLLAVCMLMPAASAYTAKELRTADAMNSLGLFYGNGNDYDLNSKLTRVSGVALLVRMIGKEDAAQNGTFRTPFTDVAGWAKGYVGYAFTYGITSGVSATAFDPNGQMTDNMFLTLTLRALGYTDVGANASFNWRNPYALAMQVGLIDSTVPDTSFTRGDAIVIFWNALRAKLVNRNMTLVENLIQQGLFTTKDFENAKDEQMNGRKENAGIPKNPTSNNSSTGTSNSGNNNTSGSNVSLSYEEYIAMSGTEQQKFYESFSDPIDFFNWINDAKAKYEKEHPSIEIGSDGSIDLGDFA